MAEEVDANGEKPLECRYYADEEEIHVPTPPGHWVRFLKKPPV